MAPPKVINLGFPKSGTTTLAQALTQAGFRVADWKLRGAGQKGFVGGLMYRGYFETGDPLTYLGDYDAFSEIDVVRDKRNFWPQCDFALIQAIRDTHPGALFLLSSRDAEAQADSMMRWSDMGTRRLPMTNIPGLPKGFGKTRADLTRWITGHVAFCQKVFEGAEDFLAYDINDPEAPGKIGAFLGRDLPWWGVANANPPVDELKEGAA
ncbi:sulfotransferase [Aliiroseovarius subalbicans]|uniref:sulfotransferase n=1 Tax=Aliiroseovarius subalbicans TaxID=2925840 RepID=UPI001F59BD08|nr:sulfotransferase [Aliiroseovarius subalbicans]MCI2398851.1 sulfotransferase family protein [Aliiroseovarius subalbicans]